MCVTINDHARSSASCEWRTPCSGILINATGSSFNRPGPSPRGSTASSRNPSGFQRLRFEASPGPNAILRSENAEPSKPFVKRQGLFPARRTHRRRCFPSRPDSQTVGIPTVNPRRHVARRCRPRCRLPANRRSDRLRPARLVALRLSRAAAEKTMPIIVTRTRPAAPSDYTPTLGSR